MNQSNRSGLWAIAGTIALALLAATGCAVSQSVDSSSDSSGSFSDSSGSFSDSSTSSSGDDSAYRDDVRANTVAHVRANGSPETLPLILSEVALTRGISDWEALRGTFVAVGTGLAEAGLPHADLAAYQDALAAPGSSQSEAIRESFGSATR